MTAASIKLTCGKSKLGHNHKKQDITTFQARDEQSSPFFENNFLGVKPCFLNGKIKKEQVRDLMWTSKIKDWSKIYSATCDSMTLSQWTSLVYVKYQLPQHKVPWSAVSRASLRSNKSKSKGTKSQPYPIYLSCTCVYFSNLKVVYQNKSLRKMLFGNRMWTWKTFLTWLLLSAWPFTVEILKRTEKLWLHV